MDDFQRGRGNGPGWRDGGWGYMHDGMGWAGWLFMGLFLLFLVALLAAVVLLVVRSTGRSRDGAPGGASGPSSAEQVLDERFARGEIDEEEYLHRRSVLRGSS